MARSIENIFTSLSSINDSLTKVIDQAKKMSADSSVFDGEIARVLGEQLDKYFIPAIVKLRDDETVPGSIIGITQFLDSIPLAMARQGFSSSEYNLPEVDQVEVSTGIETPEGSAPITAAEEQGAVSNAVDELPRNVSYANPEGIPEEGAPAEETMTEAKNTDTCIKNAKNWDEFDDCLLSKSDWWFNRFSILADKYAKAKAIEEVRKQGLSKEEEDEAIRAIKREEEIFYKNLDLEVAKALALKVDHPYLDKYFAGGSTGREGKVQESYNKYRVVRSSSVGSTLDEDLAKIEPVVVAEYDTEEEAKEVADKLNTTVDGEEKDLLGTEYSVECKEFNEEEQK